MIQSNLYGNIQPRLVRGYDVTTHTEYNVNVYSNLNKEIHEFTDYIQNTLIASDINVVLISHAIYDPDTTNYNLVGKGEYRLAAQ